MNFTSDNCWGAAPEILQAVMRANAEPHPAYGADEITRRLKAAFSDLFETDAAVYPVVTGTAANAIGISALIDRGGLIYCHRSAHIYDSEAGAVEFMANASRLVQVDGENGKVAPDALAAVLAGENPGIHSMRPAVLSLSQATEAGSVYAIEELSALSAIARRYGLFVHMDGARFANALVHLGCTPAELSWRAGIDILSFGATKNGTLCAEAILSFRPQLADRLQLAWKRGGHLLSKMRFLSAQLEAYVADGLWLRNARAANAGARMLAAEISRIPSLRLTYPVETNAVFVEMPTPMFEKLAERGSAGFHGESGGYSRARYMTSFMTPESHIRAFAAELGRAAGA